MSRRDPQAQPSDRGSVGVVFIAALIDMGAQDAEAWLNAPPGAGEPWQTDPLDAFTQTGRPADASVAT